MTPLTALLAGTALAASLASASPASAKATRIKAQPSAVTASGLTRARYVIEAVNFKALDETGIDIFGSDEIVARFSAYGRSTFSGIYGGVDTGETHQFRSGQQCIYPAIDPDGVYNHTWSCNPRGAFGPVTFQITLYEFDGTLRQFLTNSTQFCLHGGNDLMTGCDDIQLASTTIGSRHVSFTEAELAAAMPTVGMSVTKLVPIGSAYQVNIRLTRKRSAIQPPVGDEPPLSPGEPGPQCVPAPNDPCP